MNKEFILALEELEKEKEISKDTLIEAIEIAILSAYRKNYGTSQNVRAVIDKETGDIDVYTRKEVVEEVEDDQIQVALEEVLEFDPDYSVGDAIEYRVTPRDFGRIAAQTAKQVVVQRIREAERGMIFDDYVNRQGEIVTGTIQRISNETIFVNMGKTEGILSAPEQVRGETYNVNSRMKFFIIDVRKNLKGPQIYLSRSHPGIVKRLFELEVPEIQDGIVEIKGLAREPGSRTKMAVYTEDEGVDPVGACVGSRGNRVQAVVDELFGEKIDIISWGDEAPQNISSALSPAKVERVIINDDGKSATVIVPDYQLSLAIGKEGQNVRLAAKLSGWKIDIKSHSQYFPEEACAEDDAYDAYERAAGAVYDELTAEENPGAAYDEPADEVADAAEAAYDEPEDAEDDAAEAAYDELEDALPEEEIAGLPDAVPEQEEAEA
ncbi:MAG: transcription termination factor NusA [Clostridiales Family XIII bacterium]|jgi:N utilization substance protein A|nr:transcription termination factor NusA [Clostridiales Family XIII bacterium]